MVLLGTLVNGIAILVGSLLGSFIRKIPESMKTTVMQSLGLAVIVLGIGMGLESEQFIIVIGSLVVGVVLGERWDLDDKLNRLGDWLENKLGAETNVDGNLSKAFVTTTLIYVVGAMSILGALDSGIREDHSVLYTKSILDGFSAIIFTSTLGIGVIFSSIPVFLYQGTIALFATQIIKVIPDALMESFIAEMTATGGIMIIAIGLNILGLTKIKVANLLPAILIVGILTSILYYWDSIILGFGQLF
ncbi:DUF554 domain-containing protein [Alteribacillus iranensis]|uniref:Membrane protein YdfK n=1 Tax=Alteribacillus iranensis TaxID=930128 RepID=A0A1I2E788_9BACI|nr:DUF554 domain-containing protein [Alteribacillus iranensis]SFE88489.1 hypothetical protein SAMN05192532_105137 [Alteribacillus iranensis]